MVLPTTMPAIGRMLSGFHGTVPVARISPTTGTVPASTGTDAQSRPSGSDIRRVAVTVATAAIIPM